MAEQPRWRGRSSSGSYRWRGWVMNGSGRQRKVGSPGSTFFPASGLPG
ncbi:hypothetical protein KCP69_18310 [Salmonella enterica subsp. enterica]|nr:hypothetical protein KCP69_18310 [Salmonella enterica subsp. enterica]